MPNLVEVPINVLDRRHPGRVIERTYTFDREKIRLVSQVHVSIVVGGPPNSSKTGLSTSLFSTMDSLVHECEADGIIEKGDLKLRFCDLDVYCLTGIAALINSEQVKGTFKQRPDQDFIDRVSNIFEYETVLNNVTIGDLPGGEPDYVTDDLAGNFDWGILVSGDYPQREKWFKFFTEVYGGSPVLDYDSENKLLMDIRSYLPNQGHETTLHGYSSKGRRADARLLSGEVMGLPRGVNTENALVRFMAHALLFDFLPKQAKSKLPNRHNLDFIQFRQQMEEQEDYQVDGFTIEHLH